jgi:hypothetical protein
MGISPANDATSSPVTGVPIPMFVSIRSTSGASFGIKGQWQLYDSSAVLDLKFLYELPQD